MDACGVDRAILVQGVGAYTFDNSYAVDSARARPDRFVSACCIDAEAPDALTKLDEWVTQRGAEGIRLFALTREARSWLAEERTFPIWRRAAELGIQIIVTILPHQLAELESVLERFPSTPVSLDHCAFALPDPARRAELYALARFDNLYLKLTTHGLDEAVAAEGSARPLVQELVATFGADHLMWGSDYCQIYDRPYAALVDLARDAVSDLDEAEASQILAGTARKLWPGLSR
jgi:predicted TIM-barrel fold metal-dependent hydrolase